MALSPLGIFSAAGAGGVAQTYELISTTILGSSQPSVTFNVSSLGSTYRHLQIRTVNRNSGTGATPAGLWLRFNSDNGNNYAWHRLYNNVSDGASSTNRILAGITTADGATAQAFGPAVIDILDAYASKNKTIRSFSGANTVSNSTVQLGSGLWLSTTAPTAIELTTDNNFMAGSRFSIYGVRG